MSRSRGLLAWCVGPLVVSSAVCVATPTRIRIQNERLGEAFTWAIQRSPTFRPLIATIEASDLVVYADEGVCPTAAAGCLRVLSGSAVRAVSIHVNTRQPLLAVVRLLAHELQHASEIASAGHVADVDSLKHLYGQIGFPNDSGGESWESWQAQFVETRVVMEVNAR